LPDGQAELQARGGADAPSIVRELVFTAQQDVADADRVALCPTGAQRLRRRAEAAAGGAAGDDLALHPTPKSVSMTGIRRLTSTLSSTAVGQAEGADMCCGASDVRRRLAVGEANCCRVELLDDDRISRLQPLDAAPVELVELDVLVSSR